MKRIGSGNRVLMYVALVTLFFAASKAATADVSIMISKEATKPEQVAANELRDYRGQLYPTETFTVSAGRPIGRAEHVSRIGTPASTPGLIEHLGDRRLQGPESYAITNTRINDKPTGLIVGADPAGVTYGVYGLLEELRRALR